MGPIGRGLAAGAAGTTALTAVTYADMAWRGRAPSRVPEELVERVLASLGVALPGSRAEVGHRTTALAAVAGIGTGLAVGVLASLARSTGVRASAPVGAVATGATAMAAANVPLAALGVTNPRNWSQ